LKKSSKLSKTPKQRNLETEDKAFQPDKLAAEIKELALKSGANLVGIVSAKAIDDLPRIFVGWKIREYTKKTVDTMPDAKSVVVIGYHLWDKILELAIKKDNEWKYPGYFALPYLSQAIISHLEKKHYKAAMTGSLSYKRLAQLAGLGNYGKNALIINPIYGPWIRLSAIITNADMTPDKPFEKDLCGTCQACLKACPIGALTAYKVDDQKCLVGIHLSHKEKFEQNKEWTKCEPSLTKNSHLMCTRCQEACKHGKQKHH
jgi:epoxyqueuosine reductase